MIERKANSIEELQQYWMDPYTQWYAAGMPGFVTVNLEPWKQVTIKFKTMEDRKTFAEHINQSLTDKTNTIWYPEKFREKNIMNRVIEDE